MTRDMIAFRQRIIRLFNDRFLTEQQADELLKDSYALAEKLDAFVKENIDAIAQQAETK